MRILSRYFAVGYLTYYAAIVVVSLLVIAILEMMVNFDHVIEYGDGLPGVVAYLFLRLPSYYLPYLLPVGSYGAAFLCLGLPARSLEILAAKTCGISPRQLAVPVIATAALLSIVALVLNETIVLDAARRFKRDSGKSELYQSHGAFWSRRGDTLVRVESADRDSRTLTGVSIYQRDRDGHLVRSIDADRIQIEDGDWHLEGARFRDFDPGDPAAAPRTEWRETADLDLGSAGDMALLDADPRSLPLLRLRRYIADLRREGHDTTRYRALWNARLADPLTVLVFAVLGAPLGMSVERSRSLAVAALQGVALLGLYYGLQTTATVLGSGGVPRAASAPWWVLGAFSAFALLRLARSGR